MSLFNESIDVRSTTGGQPALFSWRGHMYRVRRVVATWRGDGHGATPGEVRLIRVAAESDEGGAKIADITFDSGTDEWTMRRLWG